MPSLGDAYDEAADAWAGRRLYLGAALLFVGAAIAAPGLVRVTAGALEAAGVAEATALTLAIAVAGLAVPVVGASLLQWVPASRRLRTVGAAGVLLSTLAVAAFLVTVPPGTLTGTGSLPGLIVLTYGAGAMLALWTPIVAAGLAADENRQDRPTKTTTKTFVRDTGPARSSGRVPADGGEDEEQLAFLLDHDDK